MAARAAPCCPPAAPRISATPSTLEQEVWALRTLFTDPAADYWAWEYLVAGDPADGCREFKVRPRRRTGSSGATLAVRFVGLSDLPGVPEYHVSCT